MLIRNATSGDVDQILKIKSGIDLETINTRLEKQSQGLVEFLVVEDDNNLVSFVFLKWQGKATHPQYPDMEDLYTRQQFRGRGYATALIKKCEQLSHQKGFTKIGLAVNPDLNQLALQFYQHLGYQSTNEPSYIDGVYNGVEDWCIDLEKNL